MKFPRLLLSPFLLLANSGIWYAPLPRPPRRCLARHVSEVTFNLRLQNTFSLIDSFVLGSNCIATHGFVVQPYRRLLILGAMGEKCWISPTREMSSFKRCLSSCWPALISLRISASRRARRRSTIRRLRKKISRRTGNRSANSICMIRWFGWLRHQAVPNCYSEVKSQTETFPTVRVIGKNSVKDSQLIKDLPAAMGIESLQPLRHRQSTLLQVANCLSSPTPSNLPRRPCRRAFWCICAIELGVRPVRRETADSESDRRRHSSTTLCATSR